MARQEIDLTTPQPNGKMGEPTKSAWEKVNDMTEELYSFYNLPTSIAYAETTTEHFAGGSESDVPGLTVTFQAPAGSFNVVFGGSYLGVSGSIGSIRLYVNNILQSQIVVTNGSFITSSRSVRISGIPEGTIVTAKIAAIAISGTQIRVYSDANDRFSIGVTR